MSESKNSIAYIDSFARFNVKTSFTFPGFDFTVRALKNFKGEVFRKCQPGALNKAMKRMVAVIRDWRIHRSTAPINEDTDVTTRRSEDGLRTTIGSAIASLHIDCMRLCSHGY